MWSEVKEAPSGARLTVISVAAVQGGAEDWECAECGINAHGGQLYAEGEVPPPRHHHLLPLFLAMLSLSWRF
jgi:hypothetical protein